MFLPPKPKDGEEDDSVDAAEDIAPDVVIGDGEGSATLEIRSGQGQPAGLVVATEESDAAFGVYAFGGGEQVVMQKDDKPVMEVRRDKERERERERDFFDGEISWD